MVLNMIRPFKMADLTRVMEIWIQTMPLSHPFFTPTHFINLYSEFQKEQLLKSQTHVYEIEGKIVGFISIRQDMEITAVCVDKLFQKQGIGEKMLDFIINKFQKVHCKCYLNNLSGMALLNKNGFVVHQIIKSKETKQVIYLMQKDLNQDKKFIN